MVQIYIYTNKFTIMIAGTDCKSALTITGKTLAEIHRNRPKIRYSLL